jgi:hypothetical protein
VFLLYMFRVLGLCPFLRSFNELLFVKICMNASFIGDMIQVSVEKNIQDMVWF